MAPTLMGASALPFGRELCGPVQAKEKSSEKKMPAACRGRIY